MWLRVLVGSVPPDVTEPASGGGGSEPVEGAVGTGGVLGVEGPETPGSPGSPGRLVSSEPPLVGTRGSLVPLGSRPETTRSTTPPIDESLSSPDPEVLSLVVPSPPARTFLVTSLATSETEGEEPPVVDAVDVRERRRPSPSSRRCSGHPAAPATPTIARPWTHGRRTRPTRRSRRRRPTGGAGRRAAGRSPRAWRAAAGAPRTRCPCRPGAHSAGRAGSRRCAGPCAS